MDHSCIAPAKDQTEGSQDNSCMTVPPGSKHGRSKDQTASCGRLFERRQCCQPTRTILPEKPGRTGGDEESWNLYCCLTFHCAKLQIYKDHQGPIPRTSKRTSKDKYARRRLDFSPFGGSTVIFIPFCNTLTGK